MPGSSDKSQALQVPPRAPLGPHQSNLFDVNSNETTVRLCFAHQPLGDWPVAYDCAAQLGLSDGRGLADLPNQRIDEAQERALAAKTAAAKKP